MHVYLSKQDNEIVTTQIVGKDEGKLDLSYTAGGNVKWYGHLENSLAISQKQTKTLNIHLQYNLNNCLPGHLSPEKSKPSLEQKPTHDSS